jgi:V8-like Glu-specific endopeptidase
MVGSALRFCRGKHMRKHFLFFLVLANSSSGVIASTANATAIYGIDDRVLVDKRTSPQILNDLSKSVALIVNKSSVERNFFYSNIAADLIADPNGINLCLEEKFGKHHALNSCTGFLIGENLVASAGHCFQTSEDCENKLIIFNIRESNETKNGYRVFNQAVYECSKIVKSVFAAENGEDYSIIRLKKKVTGRTPLKLRTKGTISARDQVFMIGHPMGLPLIATKNALVNDISDTHLFKATLDSFEGNSGSPVFNSKTFEVEGILVSGEDDLVLNESRQCNQNLVYNQGTLASPSTQGEGVTRISKIQSFLKR